MTNNVRTQSITNGQIGQICDRLTTKLRESGLLLENVQKVLKMPGGPVIEEMFAVFCKHVEVMNKTVTRSAPVNRARTPMEALKATGRVPHVNETVASAMPVCTGDHVEMLFVNIGRAVACNKLDSELEKMGFELIVDPVGLAAINEADKAFADTYPNGDQWVDADGNYCCAVFVRLHDERDVSVYRRYGGWAGICWFPVRRKKYSGSGHGSPSNILTLVHKV